MGGMRKHIDHPSAQTTVACPVHQEARITRQGGGVATDIHNALWKLPGTTKLWILMQLSHRLGQRKCALSRWVDQPLVCNAVRHEHFGRHLKQIARNESGGC